MRKSVIVFCVIVLASTILITVYNKTDNKKILENENNSTHVINNNSLTMMYETGYESGEYQVSSDNAWPESGYTFNAELSKCENGSKLSWDDENKKVLMQTNTSDKCYVYFDKEGTLADLCSGKTFAECITTQVYTGVDGDNDLYYHDGVGTYVNASQEAGDNSYRYAGVNPNNYVCFGSDETTCPEDNLYRIIGVFNGDVKLIKNTSIGSYSWDEDKISYDSITEMSNTSKKNKIIKLNGILAESTPPRDGGALWSESDLYYYINHSEYYDKLNVILQDKISNYNWHDVQGYVEGIILKDKKLKSIFEYERLTSSISSKIGLIYMSDYGYASSPENWPKTVENSFKTNNWLYTGLEEWTIMGYPGAECSYYINVDGILSFADSHNQKNVRPTFYLNKDVILKSGDGSINSPYKIEL